MLTSMVTSSAWACLARSAYKRCHMRRDESGHLRLQAQPGPNKILREDFEWLHRVLPGHMPVACDQFAESQQIQLFQGIVVSKCLLVLTFRAGQDAK